MPPMQDLCSWLKSYPSTKMFSKSRLIGVITVALLALLIAWGWRSWQEAEERRLTAAYAELFPKFPAGIRDRYHSKTEAFTDTVEQYRFDGGSQTLVDQLIQRFQLTPAKVLLESGDPAPAWWAIPAEVDIYTRGAGQEYTMLVFDPKNRRIFFERTQT